MTNTTGTSSPSGSQFIVETLFALLAVGSLILFGLLEMTTLRGEVARMAMLTDLVVCALFWVKAAWDLYRAPSRLKWLRWGWADVLAAIPSTAE